ncbi:sialidase family protein [Wenzhouxiangella marina]|nr:sialidase family protein [Wenzhouxiangella marina]MBB6085872.1 hypothetical protein [Wenzhouxiangella marina]
MLSRRVFLACLLLLPAGLWAQAVQVSGSGGFDYQADVIQPWGSSGERVAVFERLNPATLSGDLYLTRSSDHGASWTPPVAIVSGSANQRHASLVQTGVTQFQLFFLSNGSGGFRIHRASSTDLLDWTEHGPIELGWPNAGEINPQVIRRPDGVLLMVYHRLSGPAYIARSDDQGLSWDTHRIQISPGSAALPRLTYRPEDGMHLLVYQTNPGNNQLELWARRTQDPAAWSEAPGRIVTDGNNHDAWPIVMRDGRFRVWWARVIDGSFQVVSSDSQSGAAWSPPVQRIERPGLANIQPRVLVLDDGLFDLYWGGASNGAGSDYDILRDRVLDDLRFSDRFATP